MATSSLAQILIRLALAALAERVDPTNPVSIIEFVAGLGKALRPEDVAWIWEHVTEVARQVMVYIDANPQGPHTEESLEAWWMEQFGYRYADWSIPNDTPGNMTG